MKLLQPFWPGMAMKGKTGEDFNLPGIFKYKGYDLKKQIDFTIRYCLL